MIFSSLSQKLSQCYMVIALSVIVAGITMHSRSFASDDDLREDRPTHCAPLKPVTNFSLILASLSPLSIETKEIYRYGIVGPLDDHLIPPLSLCTIFIRAPHHISRFTGSYETLKTLIYQTNNSLVLGAKMAHALLNGVFPVSYIGNLTNLRLTADYGGTVHAEIMAAEKIFFTAAASEFLKRIEYDECLAHQFAGINRSRPQTPIFSFLFVGATSIPKSLMISEMVNRSLEDLNWNDEASRAAVSTSVAVASSALTIMFESHKMDTVCRRVTQDPRSMLVALLQSAFFSYIFYNVCETELGLTPFVAASVFCLEALTEAVSTESHWTKTISRKYPKSCVIL